MPDDAEVIEIVSSGEDSDEQGDPTPIVQRLRSRNRNSFVKAPSGELEADGEEESEADGSEASPVPTRRLRSQDTTVIDPDEIMDGAGPSRRGSKTLPARGAKRKAMQALKGGESDEDDMDIDDAELLEEEAEGEEEVEEMDEDEAPRSGPRTRSQNRAPDEVELDGSDEDDGDTSRERIEPSLTPLSPESDGMEQDSVREETPSEGIERQTRSGKTFGMYQTRRSRLRQEALDDPDMDVDDDTDDDEDDDSFGETGQSGYAICHHSTNEQMWTCLTPRYPR
jgi:hypothetical protein